METEKNKEELIAAIKLLDNFYSGANFQKHTEKQLREMLQRIKDNKEPDTKK